MVKIRVTPEMRCNESFPYLFKHLKNELTIIKETYTENELAHIIVDNIPYAICEILNDTIKTYNLNHSYCRLKQSTSHIPSNQIIHQDFLLKIIPLLYESKANTLIHSLVNSYIKLYMRTGE